MKKKKKLIGFLELGTSTHSIIDLTYSSCMKYRKIQEYQLRDELQTQIILTKKTGAYVTMKHHIAMDTEQSRKYVNICDMRSLFK